MSALHTPGPWLYERDQDDIWTVWTRQPHTGTIATVHPGDINGRFPARANARLMATAPDLLDVAKDVLLTLQQQDTSPGSQAVLRAVIARAEGRK